MISEFSAERSEAIRSLLVSSAVSPLRAMRPLASLALVALGLTVGATVSAAAINLSAPASQPETASAGVPAPAGVIPGQPIVSILGSPVSQTVQGNGDVALETLPEGATHARVSITCLTPGTTSWGLDPGGNNPSLTCTVDDVLNASGAAYFDFPVDADSTTLLVRAADDRASIISYQFLNYVETAWGVNASGETFGVSKEGLGEPDLIAVSARTPRGEQILAYSRSADLNAFGPDWPGQPSNPTEALAWQAERDQRYPDGWDIPAYKSDGITVVGAFHIGG